MIQKFVIDIKSEKEGEGRRRQEFLSKPGLNKLNGNLSSPFLKISQCGCEDVDMWTYFSLSSTQQMNISNYSVQL